MRKLTRQTTASPRWSSPTPSCGWRTTAPWVGPVTAAAFVSTIDDITRFTSAHELEASLGLVPSERSSGERRQLGHITKTGNTRMRWLLVEAAWCILRSKSSKTAALRGWASVIITRRGTRIAAVALARRLAGILFAMWRDGVASDARKIRGARPVGVRTRAVPLGDGRERVGEAFDGEGDTQCRTREPLWRSEIVPCR